MRTASGLAMLVALLMLLGAGGGAMKLYMDRQSMADVISEYGTTLTSLPVAGEAAQAFASAAETARAGRYSEARAQLERGRAAIGQAEAMGTPSLPGIGGMPGIGAPAPEAEPTDDEVKEALQSLPAEARPFFEKRMELFRRALAVSTAARQVAPDKWTPYRERIIKAAAAGDEAGVEAAMNEARRELGLGRRAGVEGGRRGSGGPSRAGGPGGPPIPGIMPGGDIPAEQLGGAIAQAKQMLAQAQAMGVDTSKVAGIVERADRELRAGNPEKSAASLREAFEVARAAMMGGGGPPSGMGRMGGGPPGGRGAGGRQGGGGGFGSRQGGPRMGAFGPGAGMGFPGQGLGFGMGMMAQGPGQGSGPQGMFPGVFGTLMGAVREDSRVLDALMDDLENAGLAMREKNQDQVRDILAAARNKVASLSKRRETIGQELMAGQGAPPAAGPERMGATTGPEGWAGVGQRQGGPRTGRQGRGGQFPGGERPAGTGPEGLFGGLPMMGMMPGMFDFQRIQDVIGRALDEARQLPDAEYAQQREGLVQQLMWGLVAAVTGQGMGPAPQQTGPALGGEGLPPLRVPDEEPQDPAARKELETQIRNRLRLLQDPCAVLAQVGADMTQVEVALSQAREAVNAGRLVEAAKATNQTSDMIWQLEGNYQEQIQALRAPATVGPPGGPQ